MTTGDGTPDPTVPPTAVTPGSSVLEAGLKPGNDAYVAALRQAGVDVTYRPLPGSHEWPYWRRALRTVIDDWGLFRPVAERPTTWTYRTVVRRGSMWALSFRFSSAPTAVATFTRNGTRLSAAGRGRVTVTAPGGCRIVATLPFSRRMPAACLAALAGTETGTGTGTGGGSTGQGGTPPPPPPAFTG